MGGFGGLIIHKTAAPLCRQNQSITVDYVESRSSLKYSKAPKQEGKGKRDKQVQGEHVSLMARLATRRSHPRALPVDGTPEKPSNGEREREVLVLNSRSARK